MISYKINHFHAIWNKPYDAFRVLAGCRVCAVLRSCHYTHAFTLVTKWGNSPDCHMKYILLQRPKVLLYFYTFQSILNTFYNCIFFTMKPRCSDIYAIYVTPLPYMSLQRVTYTIYAVTYRVIYGSNIYFMCRHICAQCDSSNTYMLNV